jgi:hypothetical protein
MRFVVRTAILLVAFCLPFVLLALASRRQENGGMYLVFPVFLALPVVLSALIVFGPLERALDGRGLGHLKNTLVPLLGGALVVLLAVAWWTILGVLNAVATRTPVGMLTRLARNPTGLVLWGVIGVVCGTLWRLTDWAAMLLGLRDRGASPP